MRNKRLIIALLAAITFGLVAAVSVSRYLASAAAYTKNLRTVVVAKVGMAHAGGDVLWVRVRTGGALP